MPAGVALEQALHNRFRRDPLGDLRMLEINPASHTQQQQALGPDSAFAASAGIFSFAIAFPSRSVARLARASSAAHLRQ